jgi:Putative adhesin
MPQWTIDRPEQVTFGAVSALSVRVVGGRLAVLASDGPPTLDVAEIMSPPLIVTHDEATGHLTVTFKDLTWDGILGWLRPGSRSSTLTLTVPKECPVQVAVVSASAVVAGFESDTRVKNVSGEIVLDGVSGSVQAETVSGSVESRGLEGDLSFNSVSGDLTVAGGTPRRLAAKTVSGRITADLELIPTSLVQLNSISGDIVVRLPEIVDTDVSVHSTSGRLESAFAGLDGVRRPAHRTLRGRLGGGMASLTANTVSGGVTLLSRQTTDWREEERA